jgi:hypothetical protein
MKSFTVDVPECFASEIMDYVHRLSLGEELMVVAKVPEPQSRGNRKKLTAAAVLEIRRKHVDDGISQYALSKKYRLAQSTVSDIINRKIWKHI